MNHGHRWLIGTLAVIALAVTLALTAVAGHDSLANGTTIYVDPDAVGRPDGTSWITAFHNLQPALDAAGAAPMADPGRHIPPATALAEP